MPFFTGTLLWVLLLVGRAMALPELSHTLTGDKKNSEESGASFREQVINLDLIIPLYDQKHFTGILGRERHFRREAPGDTGSFSAVFRGWGFLWLGPWQDDLRFFLSNKTYTKSLSDREQAMQELTAGFLYRWPPGGKLRFIWRVRSWPFLTRHILDILYETTHTNGWNFKLGSSAGEISWRQSPESTLWSAGLVADSQSYQTLGEEKAWSVGYNVRLKAGASRQLYGPVQWEISLMTGFEFLEFFDREGDLLRKETNRETVILHTALSLIL